MTTLHLSLKREFFEAIRAGSKTEEYRLLSAHWNTRLEGRSYDDIELTLGYPPKGDDSKRLRRPWRGFTRKTITHPLFGVEPVEVYAIVVNSPAWPFPVSAHDWSKP